MMKRRMRLRHLLAALMCSTGLAAAVTAPVVAQTAPATTAATLVADDIAFAADTGLLTATGNVEVFYNGAMLRAGQIIFNQSTQALEVTGPITLIDGPDTVIFADAAQISPDLRSGLLQGARLVVDQKLQIAATQISRSEDGRYTQMYQTVASSCTICANNPVPVWQIRAKRVIHDTEERQLYFDQAQLRVVGLPIAYIPRLRLPDPTLERATGFLTPEISSNDQLGTGIKLPYFIAIDPHRDLTLTPYLSTGGTRTLEARYRQAFAAGSLEINGAVSEDDLNVEPWRGYVFAEGHFDVGNDHVLSFDLEMVSDPSYLLSYGYSEKDRLDSRLALTKVDRDTFSEAEIIAFQSLRSSDDNRFLPTIMSTVGTTRRFEPSWLGGIATARLEAHGYYRTESDFSLGPAGDVTRLGASLDWQRSWILSSGVVTTVKAAGHLDHYGISQDPAFPSASVTRATGYLGFEARLPMARAGANGVTHILEPVVQAVFAPSSSHAVPNEDSTTVDFDEGSLFSFSRFAGRDAQEHGNRLNIGITYTRIDPRGWDFGLTLGRVVRDGDPQQFNPGTGLDGNSSDWLASVHLGLGDRFSIQQRSLFDDQFSFARSETIFNWNSDTWDIASGFTWLQADPAAGRPIDTSEWVMDAQFDLGSDWTAQADWRYDFVTNDASSAGLGLTYHSDCVKVEFDVSRRFTSTATLSPATTFGLTVDLTGFGAGNDGARGKRRACYH